MLRTHFSSKACNTGLKPTQYLDFDVFLSKFSAHSRKRRRKTLNSLKIHKVEILGRLLYYCDKNITYNKFDHDRKNSFYFQS